ncbi:MAG TPA: NADH-quinone oxidoreductase subunit NuoN, partial [Alphaproteobacteria bacterium]|nr:NADH-quinone oxidoreductase subunit NuoN [Alphaproteobacteria bacterium]
LVVDPFARFVKILILAGSASAIIMSQQFIRSERIERFEYPLLILFATVGMMIMVSANDLVAFYLGVEFQSLALYVLAAFNRDSLRASEAGLKYFVLGALSSGLLLYGASLIYGFAGTTSFPAIAQVVAAEGAPIGLTFGLVFLTASLAFKVSAVPFHMWTPDVYEGAPTPVTAFFAAAPKLAAMALLLRVMVGPFGQLAAQWQQIFIVVAAGSMILGAFAAINQTNIKRLLAYSSIGHVGYALIGLSAGGEKGVQSVIIYMTIYLVMVVGTWGCVLCMRQHDRMVEKIGDLAGLGRTHPMLALAMAIFMFSMAGIPPLAGFFGKVYVFLAAIEAQLYTLAVIGVLSSVVAAYYYLKIVKLMYFDEPKDALARPINRELAWVIAATGFFTLLFFVYPGPVLTRAGAAAAALFAS